MAKLTDAGENKIADCFFKGTARPSFYVGLYSNAAEPGETAALADITEVAALYGYARQQITDGDWTLTADHVTAAQKTFTAAGGSWGLVKGWFLCDCSSGTSGIVIAVESFSASYDMASGAILKLTVTMTLG